VLAGLADDRAGGAVALASPGRPAFAPLSRVDRVRGGRTDGAISVGAAAWFACRTSAVHRAGDHDLVVGEVLELGEGEPTAGGLVHHRGRLRAVTGAERRIARGNRRQAGSA